LQNNNSLIKGKTIMSNSTQYAKTLTGVPKLDTNEYYGRARIAFADFTFASTAAGSVNMFTIPNGARIISGRLHHAALGSVQLYL